MIALELMKIALMMEVLKLKKPLKAVKMTVMKVT